MKKFYPMMTRILVKPVIEPIVEKKEGDENPTPKGNSVMTAEVLAVGPAVEKIAIGNTVMFSPFGFDEIFINDEKLLVIDESLILGKYEE